MNIHSARQRIGCLFVLSALLLFPAPMHAEAAAQWEIQLSDQLEADASGEISYDLHLDGFRDYGMDISVEWLDESGEALTQTPDGVQFAGGEGSPTDKKLSFDVEENAPAGTHTFRVVVDGCASAPCDLTLGAQEEPAAPIKAAGETIEAHAVFSDAAPQVTISVEPIDNASRVQSACALAQVDTQHAALYAIHFYDANGREMETLSEKIYAYLPFDGAQDAAVYVVSASSAQRVSSRMSDKGLRIAVKDAGEYLLVP